MLRRTELAFKQRGRIAQLWRVKLRMESQATKQPPVDAGRRIDWR